MVTSVYNVLKAAQPEFDFSADVNLTFKDIGSLSEETLNIVKYSVAKGILHGRNKEILDLESQCTRQELLVFVKMLRRRRNICANESRRKHICVYKILKASFIFLIVE